MLKSYAGRQASRLLRNLTTQIREAQEGVTEDSVHDLRTGIRRLSECLKTFRMFFPEAEAGEVRRELKKMMRLAGDVRNRDVAEKLFSKSDEALPEAVTTKLQKQHREAKAALAMKVEEWASEDFPRRCRSELKLNGEEVSPRMG